MPGTPWTLGMGPQTSFADTRLHGLLQDSAAVGASGEMSVLVAHALSGSSPHPVLQAPGTDASRGVPGLCRPLRPCDGTPAHVLQAPSLLGGPHSSAMSTVFPEARAQEGDWLGPESCGVEWVTTSTELPFLFPS